MRIVKELTIEDIHITIFKMENRWTMKLEWNRLEQVFKLDTRENIESIDNALALISKDFINGAQKVFGMMAEHKTASLNAVNELKEDEEFPEII